MLILTCTHLRNTLPIVSATLSPWLPDWLLRARTKLHRSKHYPGHSVANFGGVGDHGNIDGERLYEETLAKDQIVG